MRDSARTMLSIILKLQAGKILNDDNINEELGYDSIHEMVERKIWENVEDNIDYIVNEFSFRIMTHNDIEGCSIFVKKNKA